MRARPGRPAATGCALFVIGLGMSGPVEAACKAELPDPALHALDASADHDPIGTIATVRTLLAERTGAAAVHRAQLFAIASDASETIADDRLTRSFADAGLRELGTALGADAERVRRRLQLSLANGAGSRGELEAALPILDSLLASSGTQLLEKACIQLVRSRVTAQLRMDEASITDALAAHEAALALDRPDVRAETASQLGSVYGTAGLFDLAVPLADEALAHAERAGASPGLGNATYFAAAVRIDAARFEEALPLIAAQEAIASRLDDAVGMGFARLQSCQATAGLKRWTSAREICARAVRELVALGRPDQAARADLLLARIDADAGRTEQALQRLDRTLGQDASSVSPAAHADALRLRGEVLRALGRADAALADFAHALQLQAEQARDRERWVSAIVEARRHASEAIAQRDSALARERNAAAQADLLRARARATAAFALGSGISAVAIAALFWLRVRHERRTAELRDSIELQARVMDSMRDGIAIFDAQDALRYANRSFSRMLSGGAEPPPGQTAPAFAQLVEELRVERLRNASQLAFELEVRRDSPSTPLLVRVEYMRVGTGDRMAHACVLQDVTERRRTEWEILDRHRREQAHVSRLLHEDLAQDLSGIALLADSLRASGPEATEVVQYLRAAIDKARGIARGLSPVHLSNGSVTRALERLAAGFMESEALRVRLELPADLDALDPVFAEHLYATVLAGITLLREQLGAQDVGISIDVEPQRIHLIVSGTRAPDAALDSPDLDGLSWRVRATGGTLRAELDAAGSVLMRATFPLALGTSS